MWRAFRNRSPPFFIVSLVQWKGLPGQYGLHAGLCSRAHSYLSDAFEKTATDFPSSGGNVIDFHEHVHDFLQIFGDCPLFTLGISFYNK